MDSQTLYRKYRPKNFGEVIGQKHIVQTLVNAIKNNRVGQAYLFTGPRGTGKTSIARILAKTINCENLETKSPSAGLTTCEQCPACETISDGRSLDIIEIDAASNTGVDNIRELRETINLPPTSLKYKVYIIDEVHMLSTGAFNALLKTLEEPPSHVIFILATTEIHKVPETIISRCQRFDFTRLPIRNIIEKLSLIAKNEKIKIDADSLEMIAIAAEGGMRDAESLFGQVIALEDKNITIKEVEEILGTTDRKFSYEIAEMIINDDSTNAILRINELLNDGYDLAVFNKSLINYLRQLMLLKISPDLKSSFAYEITGEQIEKMLAQAQRTELKKILIAINLFMDAQNKISSFMLPQLPLEIAIIKATHTFPAVVQAISYTTQSGINIETENKNNLKHKEQNTNHKQSTNAQNTNTQECHSELVEGSNQKNPVVEQGSLQGKKILTYDVQSNWNKLLDAIKPLNHSLQALLFSCQVVSVENNLITLATPYDFYKEKLNDHANRQTVEQVFDKILGSKISLKTVTNKEAGVHPVKSSHGEVGSAEFNGVKTEPKQQNSLLNDAINIMGGKVVAE